MCRCATTPTTSTINAGANNCSCSGSVTNPLSDPRNCLRHQSPAGFHYVWSDAKKKCILVNNVTGAIVNQDAMPLNNNIDLSNPTDIVNKFTAFIKANPLLSAGIGFGAYYFFTKKK